MQTPCKYQLCVSALFLLCRFFPTVAAAVDCRGGASPFIITTQQDVDSLLGCIDEKLSEERRLKIGYQGSITISPWATGVLNFIGYDYVNGSLLVENAPGLQKLYLWPAKSPGHPSGFHGVTLRNLSGLTSFGQFGQESIPHRTALNTLPLLEELTLDGSGFSQPVDLELVSLPRLRESRFPRASGGIKTGGNLTINDVGLDNIDDFLYAGSGINASYTVSELRNVATATISLFSGTNLRLEGNGTLSVDFNCPLCRDQPPPNGFYMRSLHLSGINSLSRNYAGTGKMDNLTVGSLTISDNRNLEVLPMLFDNITNLTLQSNRRLHTVLFNASAARYSWSSIRIAFNKGLRLKSAVGGSDMKPGEPQKNVFYWPTKNVSSMVFSGNFDDAFFQPFIDLGKDKSKRPLVLNKFEVYSDVTGIGFNCSKLNELRRAGILQGEYTCNFQTVPDETASGVGRIQVPGQGLWGVALGVAMVLVIEFCYVAAGLA
ncbi:hypothetical protein B0T14DRAFT_583471 [Immersiella caudata]|uniref:Uncharacterized protein n=1 Tax=Immersiella caudata TaxID=314043 RepID=A0AA39WZS1_9PEZI|nr:hypothetical protein B0T14DRAFT_583471 [Immersiella caudata]